MKEHVLRFVPYRLTYPWPSGPRRRMILLAIFLITGLAALTLLLADGGGPGFALGALVTLMGLFWLARTAYAALIRAARTASAQVARHRAGGRVTE